MSASESHAHVALLPSAGMGHLTPFLRLAALLACNDVMVTLIITRPAVSLAESQLLSRFRSSLPQVKLVDLHLLPLDPTTVNSSDPFWLRFEAIRRSSHLLSPLILSLEPPLSAFVLDMTLISPVIPVTHALSLPSFIFFTSSVKMLSFFSYLPTASFSDHDDLSIPGISPIPRSSIPPLLLMPDSLFANIFFQDSANLAKLDGVLINSFKNLEPETIEAINGGEILRKLIPPVFDIGPFMPCEFENVDNGNSVVTPLKWLDEQPQDSVVYVSFGSRTAMKRDQVREIGDGLLKSGCRFLWIVKDKSVDRDEEEEVEEIVGRELIAKLKKNGLVVKTWVDQRQILGHRSVGGFVSHCGWNSVTEAAWYGVRILAWPQHGDQRINADVVEKSGLGVWEEKWGWGQEVKGEEIGKRIKDMMNDESLKKSAEQLRDAAREAVGDGGTSHVALQRLIGEWKKKKMNTSATA
ncbi:UDP-glycosyltransferase 708G1-like [Prosopis cineraria]|uniref:UDP-glycosyltransferase 708G1-like n=1 Tax=Prosopis cineraria TaxID=364024 RepID=UPI00240EA169|nr:UDP-glycosyltransferase 708G1-like [Prosopis cineraria]